MPVAQILTEILLYPCCQYSFTLLYINAKKVKVNQDRKGRYILKSAEAKEMAHPIDERKNAQ